MVEQSVTIVRLILERLNSFSEHLAPVDIESLILMFTKYLNRLGRKTNALRIKIKLCQVWFPLSF